MKRLASLTLVVLSALAVAACGLRGNLERPDPLWGDRPPADEDAGELPRTAGTDRLKRLTKV